MSSIVFPDHARGLKIVIFDTSAINALKKDSERTLLLAGIRSAYYTRLTAYNVHEIASARDSSDRNELLDVCQELLRSGECVHRPQAIIEAVVKDYEAHGSSYWNGEIRLPEYERIIVDRDVFGAAAEQQRVSGEQAEAAFRAVFGELRPEFDQLFREGSERPKDFAAWLILLKPSGGGFWNYAARVYKQAAGYFPDEGKMRAFVGECPPMNVVVLSLLLAQFERSVRDMRLSPSYRAGHVDLFSAVYLPYCDVFVTGDQKQERCLQEIVSAAGLITEIRSYGEFRDRLLPELGMPQKAKREESS